MKVICLSENQPGAGGCPGEHGLSLYIETGAHRILMDTGQSDLFIRNAETLGVDLSAVDTVVLTHGHYDHGGGLPFFLKINQTAKIYASENAFRQFYSIHDDEARYIGLPEGLEQEERIIRVLGNQTLDANLSVLAEIPENHPVPSASAALKVKHNGVLEPDTFDHEIALVVREGSALYLFSGCAHHGILNILDGFRAVYRNEPAAVFSGFHMKKQRYEDEDINMILDTAMALNRTHSVYYTGHCTGTAPYEAMKKIMKDKLNYIHSGDIVTLAPKKGKGGMHWHKLFAWGTVVCFAMTMITGYRHK